MIFIKMETPYFNYDEFKNDFLNVYEPAEDSFLLLDALQNDLNLIKNLNPLICMEIGSGSGILITTLARSLKFGYFLSTDINPFACETTLKCALKNEIAGKIEVVNTNLSDCLNDKLRNKVDLLIFNPPYVPTDNSEITESLLNRSWAGGKDGRVIIDKFLKTCLNLLSKNGLLYLLLIKENKPNEIVEQLNEIGFDCQIVLKRKAKNESQFIIRSKKLN